MTYEQIVEDALENRIDDLRNCFEDEIVAETDFIKINGVRFDVIEVYKQFEPKHYEQAFQDWLQELDGDKVAFLFGMVADDREGK